MFASRVAVALILTAAVTGCGSVGQKRAAKAPAPPPASAAAPAPQQPANDSPSPSPSASEQILNLGEPLDISQDETPAGSITVTKVKVSTQPGVDYGEKPKNGYYLVFTVEASATDSFDLNSSDFYIRAKDGAHYDSGDGNSYEATSKDPLGFTTLNPGERTAAPLVFDVPVKNGQCVLPELQG